MKSVPAKRITASSLTSTDSSDFVASALVFDASHTGSGLTWYENGVPQGTNDPSYIYLFAGWSAAPAATDLNLNGVLDWTFTAAGPTSQNAKINAVVTILTAIGEYTR